MSVDGGEPRALWPGEGGRWTPDGRFYVFDRRDEAEGRNDVYAVREPVLPWLSPSQPVRLTFGPLSFTDVGPSPDGERLFAWGTADRGELLRYDAKAGRFGKYLDGASVYFVDASRDGQWLTWVSYPDGALWRGRSDGSDRLKLTGPGWGVFLPRWSPDGTRIVFAGRAPEERLLSIFVVSREGGAPELLARSQTRWSLWDPCWLPDGQTILYSHSGFEMLEELGIYRLDLRTRAVSVLPGTERLQYPKCSPPGRHPGDGEAGGGNGRARRTGPSSSIVAGGSASGSCLHWVPELVARRPVVHRAQRSHSAHRALVAGDRPSRDRRGRE